MLELGDRPSMIEVAWENVELKPRLPEEMADFFDQHGTLISRPAVAAYLRFYVRSKAILHRQEACMGVYTADASRQGLCFLWPIQLLPEALPYSLAEDEELPNRNRSLSPVGRRVLECGASLSSAQFLQPRSSIRSSTSEFASRRSLEVELERWPSFAIS